MEQRILTVWSTWKDNTSYMLWDIYPASREALESVKKVVETLEKGGAKVIVNYEEITAKMGRRHLDYIYDAEKGPKELWKELWEEL